MGGILSTIDQSAQKQSTQGSRHESFQMILAVYYIGIKAAFLFGLVHSFVKFEPLQKSWFFMGFYLHGRGDAAELLCSLAGPVGGSDYPLEIFWLRTQGSPLSYFWLLERFDEGWIFWTLTLAGLGVVCF